MKCIFCKEKMLSTDYFDECRVCYVRYFDPNNYYFGYCTQSGIVDIVFGYEDYLHFRIYYNKIVFFKKFADKIIFPIENPTLPTLEFVNKLIKKVFKIKQII